MEGKNFSIVDSIRFGLRMFFSHFGFFVLIFLTVLAIWSGASLFINILFRLIKALIPGMDLIFLRIVRSIVSLLLIAFLSGSIYLGFMRILLDLYDEGKSHVSRLFSGFRFIINYWIAWFFILLFTIPLQLLILFSIVLRGAGVIGGFLIGMFCLVILFFVLVRLTFFNLYLVDGQVGPLGCLKMSFRATKGLWWRTLGLTAVGIALMITVIGFPAGAFTFVAAYRKLKPKGL